MIRVTQSDSGVLVTLGKVSTMYTKPEVLQALIEELQKGKSFLIERIEKKAMDQALREIWEE
jgi:hypothetical protein